MRLSELFREVEFDGSIKNDADINLVTDDSDHAYQEYTFRFGDENAAHRDGLQPPRG